MLAVTAIAGTTVVAESIPAFADPTATATINSAQLNGDGSVMLNLK